MAYHASHGLEETIVEFCRFTRECGLAVGVKESLDSLRAASAVGIAEREGLKFALRAVLCSAKGEWDAFDEIFEAFWSGKSPRRIARPANAREIPRRTYLPRRTPAGVDGAKQRCQY